MSRIVLCGMGGSSLAPEVICARGRRRARGARLLRPRLRARRTRGPAGRDGGRRLLEVRGHGRDRQPAAGVREGVRRRGDRPRRADRRGHRPGLPARRAGGAGGLPDLPRRPRRRRPLLRADRVRAGPQRPGRRRRGRAARAGRRDAERPRGRLGRQPRAAARRAAGCRQRRRRGQARAGRRGLDVRRTRRLGRAADRGVHRQGGQGHPAGGGGLGRVPELLRRARPTRSWGPTDRSPCSGRSGRPRGSASPSTPPSAPSCCSGSTPPPSPAG